MNIKDLYGNSGNRFKKINTNCEYVVESIAGISIQILYINSYFEDYTI